MLRDVATVLSLMILLVPPSHQYPAYDEDDDDNQYANVLNHVGGGGSQVSTYESLRNAGPAVGQSDDWNEIFAEEYKQSMIGQDAQGHVANGGEAPFSGKLEVVEDWPTGDLQLGQVAGLAADVDGFLHVFHRADRTWDYDSFDENDTFTKRADGPIKQPTVYQVNSSDGVVLNKWASNFFYLPHGLSIDHRGFFWMTDVAMHQVFKFESGKDKPVMTLGKAFEPARSNDDTERFCKPTDVAVASNDEFFVSDGYCASRVLKYDKSGKLIGQFGTDDFQIAHSLALAEDLDLICVADRENMRILCYNAGLKDPAKLGEPEREYNDESLGRIFAIAYSPLDGLLYGVTGPTGIFTPQGFTIDLAEDERYSVDLIATWSPDDKGFDQPHAIAVSADGNNVFVGETKPNVVWKFVKEQV
jgi:peptidylamidoglycolate lyase